MTIISELQQVLARDYEANVQAATPLIHVCRAVQRESDAWPATRVEAELKHLGFKIEKLGSKKFVWGLVLRAEAAKV